MKKEEIKNILTNVISQIKYKNICKCGNKINFLNSECFEEKNFLRFEKKCEKCKDKFNLEIKINENREVEGFISEEEVGILSKSMKNIKTISQMIGIFLFSIIFTGCEKPEALSDENIKNFKEQAGETFEKGKKIAGEIKQLAEDAPKIIKDTKKDVEATIDEIQKTGKEIKDTYEKTKEAVQKAKQAIDAVSKAADAFGNITETGGTIKK